MSYFKITNGAVEVYPYSVNQLRRDNPNVSFPRDISLEIMRRYGMFPVTTQDFPDYDPLTQKIVTATTPTYINGWVLTQNVVDMTAEEIAAYNEEIAQENRKKRNELLAATDYFALTDVTMNAAMTSYRQQLRDITDLDAWPNLTDEDWPVKP